MRRSLLCCLTFAALALARPAQAQITSLADDILLISKGVEQQEQSRGARSFDGVKGGQDSSLGPAIGGRQTGVGGPYAESMPGGGAVTASHDVLSAIGSEGQHAHGPEVMRLPAPHESLTGSVPLYGSLEVPDAEDEGPPTGLTLDMALDYMLANSADLRGKYLEIPQARADLLTASLRANPLVFATASSIPYGSYSPARPGENGYSATVIYPFDVSRKRLARTEVASRAERTLEAQYQDTVRLEIDTLYSVYTDVLAARESLRYALASQNGVRNVVNAVKRQVDAKAVAPVELEKMLIQLDLSDIGVEQAQTALVQAKQRLARMLFMPIEQTARLELRATLRDMVPNPPSRDELVRTAITNRPDLVAYRLGVQRAQADIQLAQAEKYSDLFVLYSPYELRNNAPTGGQNATSWSMAVFGSVPLFNRNQGNIRRAELNVSQTQTELVALERQVIAEVEQVYAEYTASNQATRRLEQSILPRSRRIRDASARQLHLGLAGTVDYLNAQKDYNEVVRQYRDAMIRHRRSMLKLNTVAGTRVMP